MRYPDPDVWPPEVKVFWLEPIGSNSDLGLFHIQRNEHTRLQWPWSLTCESGIQIVHSPCQSGSLCKVCTKSNKCSYDITLTEMAHVTCVTLTSHGLSRFSRCFYLPGICVQTSFFLCLPPGHWWYKCAVFFLQFLESQPTSVLSTQQRESAVREAASRWRRREA